MAAVQPSSVRRRWSFSGRQRTFTARCTVPSSSRRRTIRLAIDPFLLPEAVVCLVNEEDAPARRQKAVHKPPERLDTARRHMREEEAEEDDIAVVGRFQREGVDDPIGDAAFPHPGRIELEHLRRRVGDEQVVRVVGQRQPRSPGTPSVTAAATVAVASARA